VIETLRQIALEAYERFIGLELAEVAVDGCITKAPCAAGGEGREKPGGDRGKQGTKGSTAVDGGGIPIGGLSAPANRNDSPLLVPTLEHASASVGGLCPIWRASTWIAATTHSSPASASKSEGLKPR
jgi:hypothetical protein